MSTGPACGDRAEAGVSANIESRVEIEDRVETREKDVTRERSFCLVWRSTPCRCLQRFRNRILGPDPRANVPHNRLWRLPTFHLHCTMIMCMTEPVAWMLFITLPYVWILTMGQDGSHPIVNLMPYSAGIDASGVPVGELLLGNLWNSLFLLSTVIFATILFLVLFRFSCRRVALGILIGFFLVVTMCVPVLMLRELCRLYSLPLDWLSLIIFAYNFAATGTILVYWEDLRQTFERTAEDATTADSDSRAMTRVSSLEAPIWWLDFLTHAYLLLQCVCISWLFTCMHEWTVWGTLILLVLWDLFAVLTPCGPLKYITDLQAKRALRGEEAFQLPPGLIYKTSLFHLGTGDLLFYGVVVGRAATQGFAVAASTALAVLAGMDVTIWVTLRSSKHALPALPIAIVLAFVLLFTSKYVLVPYLKTCVEGGLIVV